MEQLKPADKDRTTAEAADAHDMGRSNEECRPVYSLATDYFALLLRNTSGKNGNSAKANHAALIKGSRWIYLALPGKNHCLETQT
jgi:hypothetical protein